MLRRFAGEAAVAKTASLVVKLGALAFVLFLPVQYALDLQLLGALILNVVVVVIVTAILSTMLEEETSATARS